MKTRFFLVQFIMIFILISCTKNENDKIDDGITFRYYDLETDNTPTLVYYNEILGYDSVKHAFVLNELAWNKFNRKVTQTDFYHFPFPDFIIEIVLNNNLVYRVGYVPLYSSTAHFDRILFKLQEPNIVSIQLEPPIEMFKGEDLRNDQRLIERLKKDNKLINLEN
ncbi:MAG: hypothetical protein K0B11_16010 [Mariniphaga sp.]|nr:hypothetical protein [Mariniphaga sp.]